MKKILLGIFIAASFSTMAFAECRSILVYGQYKQICDSAGSHTPGKQNTIEFTEMPHASKQPVSKQKSEPKNLASLEQSVNQAHLDQSPFKPTHTQLDQVRQLLEFADSQGCDWGGKYDKPILNCPNGN